MNYEKCLHYGAEYGLHEFETLHCPKNGREETREGHKQEWANSIFHEDKPFTEATIYFHGDPTVGIMSYSFTAQVPKLTDDTEDREFIRAELKRAYTQIDAEFTPTVYFDDETD